MNSRILSLSEKGNPTEKDLPLINEISKNKDQITLEEVRALIKLFNLLFRVVCSSYDEKKVKAIRTKFRDSGRRSAPWKPASSVVPGRPQDGKDGNRINRWLMDKNHKFYANEKTATLVEVKYYLQALSMKNAPDIEKYGIEQNFHPWLVESPVVSGNYTDPIQLEVMDFDGLLSNPRNFQSGHLDPLDRGGKHHPSNTFLMYYRSNQIQGNLSVEELIAFMDKVVKKHKEHSN